MLMWFLPYCCVAVSCATPGVDERARTIFDYVEARVSYTNLAVSRQVLRPEDVERWGTLLNASEAQLNQMQTMYARFVEEHNELLDREAPSLLEASAEIGRRQQEDSAAAHSERIGALISQAERLRRQLEQVEQSFIDSVAPILTEDQVAKLPALRNEAVRRQCRARRTAMPWAHVDLRAVWEEVDELVVTPDEARHVDEVLLGLESVVTPLLRQYTDAFWRSPVQISRLIARSGAGEVAEEDFFRQYDRFVDSYVRPLRRLRDLNEAAALRIADGLRDEVAAEFMAGAKAAAFPQIYPDGHAAHPLFLAVINDDDLSHEVREAAEILLGGYVEQYAQATDALERFYKEWGENNARNRDGYRMQRLPVALEPMLTQRRELTEHWLALLTEAVGEEVAERLGSVR